MVVLIFVALIISVALFYVIYKILNTNFVGMILAACFLIVVSICPIFFGIKLIITDKNTEGGFWLIIGGIIFGFFIYKGIKDEIK